MAAVVWSVCLASVAGILVRPRGIPEWVWATGGALALVGLGIVAPAAALRAVGRGTDVYLFLAGMMLLAELARREGVFDWIAGHAVAAAGGSRRALFALVYGVGVVVTAVLSNDATAVVLTPAVAAAVRRARVEPLPYLFACAFVANAASFVLPISNPANLVVFGAAMPPLGRWLALFALPSLASVALTYVALGWYARRDLRGPTGDAEPAGQLARSGRIAFGGIALAALGLVVASSVGAPLGAVTLGLATAVALVLAAFDARAVVTAARGVSWSVLLLVAGLFVIVAAVDATGALADARTAVDALAAGPLWRAVAALGTTTALVANVTNNLPAGLFAGFTVAHLAGRDALVGATAIGIDLGPNLSVTGSLATVLWLVALRRERISLDAATFLRAGAVVMPPALLGALAALLLAAR
jgi:arsenical pump membrane protein